MQPADVPAVVTLMVAAFADLDRRSGRTPAPPGDPAAAEVRVAHLLATDPGGAWVAEEAAGAVTGAALALVREGLWGLSLLVVDPGVQSAGHGRSLFAAALAHSEGTRGGVILGSEDPRALRLYARAGFDLHPAMDARGEVRHPPAVSPTVRPVRWPADRDLIDAVGRAVRGAGHGSDVEAWGAQGLEVLVDDRGGFAVHRGGAVRLVAGTDEDVAAGLLAACLAGALGEAGVDFITAGQDWAVRVLHDAGLPLRPGGAVFLRGDVGPMRPYVPSGAYL